MGYVIDFKQKLRKCNRFTEAKPEYKTIKVDEYSKYKNVLWKYNQVDSLVLDTNRIDEISLYNYDSVKDLLKTSPTITYISKELESKGIAVLSENQRIDIKNKPHIALMYRGTLVEFYKGPFIFVGVDKDYCIVSLSTKQKDYIKRNLKINKKLFGFTSYSDSFDISIYEV